MNKQTGEKVRFFLEALAGRFEENDSVKRIDAVYTSGLKKYELSAERTEKGGNNQSTLKFRFTGESFDITYGQFCDFIVDRVPQYDSLEVTLFDSDRATSIIADGKRVVTKQTDRVETLDDDDENIIGAAASMSKRDYYIRPEKAARLLKAIGLLGDNGKVRNDKIRKYNQIDHFTELVDPMLRRLCEHKRNNCEKNRQYISIVDCACGKSYLSFAIYYYVTEVLHFECRITGLDYNKIVIDDSKKIAAELGYKNMRFVETDIRRYEADMAYDMLISLHACDTATDMALRFALDHNIKSVVCVPCCHKEMNSQDYNITGLEGVLRYGILRARVADSLTDGLRAMYMEARGYDVSMVEYISPLDTPKNLMMRMERVHGASTSKLEAFDKVCESLGVHLSIAHS